MTVGLIISYARLSDLEFASKTLGMVQALTGNANFPSPYGSSFPTLAEFTTAQSEYATAVGLAADRDKSKVADRNAKREVLADIVRRLAPYLESVAAGDVAKLESTGYDLTKATHDAPIEIPDAPTDLKLKQGQLSGSVSVTAKPPKGAGSFEIQVCVGDPNVPANWRTATLSRNCRNVAVAGLQRGVDHFFRIRAIGSKGPGPWSNVESIMPV